VQAVASAAVGSYAFKNVPEAAIIALSDVNDGDDNDGLDDEDEEPKDGNPKGDDSDGRDDDSAASNNTKPWMARLRARLGLGDSGDDGADDKVVNLATMKAKLMESEREVLNLKLKNEELADHVDEMEANAKEVYQVVAEAGLDADAMKRLPNTNDDSAPDSVLDEYKAIDDPQKRREFYANHKQEILRATSK